jgi:tRNA-splicing ligase RtcB (3'-phosphate/5'-hydroxy nucleic acid ligase)
MKIERTSDYSIRIPKHDRMQVDGVVYTDRRLLAGMENDACLEQVVNVACLPGILRASYAMPDIHWGYGFPIGGVAAFDAQDGVVSPGGVGYDINCGVRLLSSRLKRDDVADKMPLIVDKLFGAVPSGLGSQHRDFSLTRNQVEQVCTRGARWAVENGYGLRDDLAFIEDGGCIPGADFAAVSDRAYERGKRQLGTLGSGNHFVEVGYVQEVIRPREAELLGLQQDAVVFSIHTGSRGFGYQVCSESIDRLQSAPARYNIQLPDRQLVCAPLKSPEGRRYLEAMACAANYAFANRQLITHFVRDAMEQLLARTWGTPGLQVVYDVAHNIAKMEEHQVDGRSRQVCVHRKGATRALPPGHPLVPRAYQEIGQPVLIPGDMGRYSYVAVGGPRALERSFGSCAHGAGRVLSRKAALRQTKGRRVDEELAHKGITVRAAGRKTLREEFPKAYKDVAHVVKVVEEAGLALPVVKLAPLGVVKG